jgi:hypothetical protein
LAACVKLGKGSGSGSGSSQNGKSDPDQHKKDADPKHYFCRFLHAFFVSFLSLILTLIATFATPTCFNGLLYSNFLSLIGVPIGYQKAFVTAVVCRFFNDFVGLPDNNTFVRT